MKINVVSVENMEDISIKVNEINVVRVELIWKILVVEVNENHGCEGREYGRY